MTAPRRRWFRLAFSLRTLFVVVAIIACWLSWQRKLVFDRYVLRDEIERRGGSFAYDYTILVPWIKKPRLNDVPLLWRVMGVQRQKLIMLPMNRWCRREGLEEIRRLFPEAAVNYDICLPGQDPNYRELPGDCVE